MKPRVQYNSIRMSARVRDFLLQRGYGPAAETQLARRAAVEMNRAFNRLSQRLPLQPEAAPLLALDRITVHSSTFTLVATLKYGHCDEREGRVVLTASLYLVQPDEAQKLLRDMGVNPDEAD
jgi:hypothetical protein